MKNIVVRFGNKVIVKNNNDISPIVKDTVIYIFIMLFAVSLRTYVTHSATIVWIVNLLGLLVCYGKYILRQKAEILIIVVLYIIASFITIGLNTEYFNGSIKALGTNINIFVFPFFAMLISSFARRKVLKDEQIEYLFKIISIIGLFTVLIAWGTGYRYLSRVFRGTLNPYRADILGISGFFYGKNIYGAFISLSLAPDLYFLAKTHQRKYIVLMIVKIAAIVLSFSRAALLQAGIMCFLFFWLNRKRTLKEWGLLGIVFLAFLVFFIFNNQFHRFIMRSVLRTSIGDAGRGFLRARALSRVGEVYKIMVFGIGFAGVDALSVDIDNTYLYLLFTGGIVKILFFIGVVYIFFLKTKELKRYNPSLACLSLAVGGSYFVFAFYESIAILELGLLNFLFALFMLVIPCGYEVEVESL